jgi:hypothetical protein
VPREEGGRGGHSVVKSSQAPVVGRESTHLSPPVLLMAGRFLALRLKRDLIPWKSLAGPDNGHWSMITSLEKPQITCSAPNSTIRIFYL